MERYEAKQMETDENYHQHRDVNVNELQS